VTEQRLTPSEAPDTGAVQSLPAPHLTVHEPQLPGALSAPPERTLIDIIRDTAARYPDASALDDGHRSLSYAQLMDEVRATARKLHLAGLGAGDKIGVRIPSGTNELYVSILAVLLVGAAYVPVDADDPDERAKLVFGEARVAGILRAGYVVVNVNPMYTPRELEHQLNDAGAEAIIVLEYFGPTVQEVIDRTPVRHIVLASLGDVFGAIKGP